MEVVVDGLGEGGERLPSFVLLLLVEVIAVNSERIEDEETLLVVVVVPVVDSLVFFSLNPVARDAQPLICFTLLVPFDSNELEPVKVE